MGPGPYGPGPYGAGATWGRGHGARAIWGRGHRALRIMAKPKIQNEKCCQGMPAKSHLEPYVSKQDFPNFDKIWSEFLPGLALLGLPRLGSASLALPAPRNNSPAAFGGRAARSGAAVVAGAGKASEADARRGEPSKPRPGEHADPLIPPLFPLNIPPYFQHMFEFMSEKKPPSLDT